MRIFPRYINYGSPTPAPPLIIRQWLSGRDRKTIIFIESHFVLPEHKRFLKLYLMNGLFISIATPGNIAHLKGFRFDFHYFRLNMNPRERGLEFQPDILTRQSLLPGPTDKSKNQRQHKPAACFYPPRAVAGAKVTLCLGCGHTGAPKIP